MNPNCKCYVGNLGNNASKEELRDTFSLYGRVKKVWVARKPPGFAFVEMDDSSDAEHVTRVLNERRVCGRRIRVEMATGRQRNSRSRIAHRKCYECGKYGHFAHDIATLAADPVTAKALLNEIAQFSQLLGMNINMDTAKVMDLKIQLDYQLVGRRSFTDPSKRSGDFLDLEKRSEQSHKIERIL
ncbi:hypothetical protein QYM36_000511 [Artemia franciscana]|uniref:RRM domain-containing protein n=1 Tax=Artemia franciscana TaxID=6661 RepID=A0AA88LGJ8_ARTSF|nr:hypothetical protein QYM36_000511 [Artemia franciscana]